MPDDVDVIEFHPNKADAEEAIQAWLDANSGITSLDATPKVYEKRGRTGLAMIHTD
ncbi:hypothetical protein [Natrinema thermotolerans]|uniref:hypothetical protein n=1 Tax=Natrinema thermotolerans TaxID=121872 RepID=UPI000A4176DA|nr:hypothetical protein [Natrinema thermotolerans]